MIGLRDSLTLAHTKVRSRRIRLLVTTIVSGLLFGLIAGGVLLFDGTAASVNRFADENLGNRYLVQGTPRMESPDFYPNPSDPAVMKEVERLHADYLAERKAAAVKYGITDYDPKTEPQPVVADAYGDPSIPADQRRMANMESVAWRRHEALARKKALENIMATPERFAGDAKAAGATDTYTPSSLQHLGLSYLANGREDLTGTNPAPDIAEDAMPEGDGSSVANSAFTLMDDELVEAFIAEPNEARSTAKGIPVLVPVDDIVTTFGKNLSLTKRPKDSSGQLAWYRNVRATANGMTFTTCYRNQAERDRVEEARRITAEIAAGRNQRGYVKPDLVLELPTTPCGAVTVAQDKRTEREKQREENRRAFDALASVLPTTTEAPRAELVTFQVVGVLPTGQAGGGNLESIISSIVGTTYGYGSIIPKQLAAQLPESLRHSALLAKKADLADPAAMQYGPMGPEASYISSFPTVDKAKAFIRSSQCEQDGGGGLFGGGYYVECDEPFAVSTYGTNYLVVDEIATGLRPYLIGLLGALFGVATIIIWAMMGRVIADSRRETAVFRAIGAKRSDIVSVYVLYSLWVAVRIAVFAGLLGAAIAVVVDLVYSRRATNAAQLAYGVFDGDARFRFLTTPSPLWWAILAGILAMAIVAITPPLLRNVRRNPIRDMRDE